MWPFQRAPKGMESESQRRARVLMDGRMVSPDAYASGLGNVAGFTLAQRLALDEIPFPDDVLRSEASKGSVLFPHHPDVTPGLIARAFGGFASYPRLVCEDNSIHGIRLGELGWRLVRTSFDPFMVPSEFGVLVEQLETVPGTHHGARLVDVLETVLLARRVLGISSILDDAEVNCAETDRGGYFARNPCVRVDRWKIRVRDVSIRAVTVTGKPGRPRGILLVRNPPVAG